MSYQVDRYVHIPVSSGMDSLWSQLAEARKKLADLTELSSSYNSAYDRCVDRLTQQVRELERMLR